MSAMAASAPFSAVDRYLARGFLVAFAVVLAVIVVLLQTLDLMNAAEELLAAEASGAGQILRYIGLRAPQLADRFIPFVALLAALITLARLGRTSEITAMRAAGLSPLRILAPVCAAGALIGCLHFAFHEAVVVDAAGALNRWEARDYAPGPAEAAPGIADVRLIDGARIVRADRMDPAGEGAWRLVNLRAYELGGGGGVASALQAETAIHDGQGWRLEGAERFEAGPRQWRPAGPAAWADGPDPQWLFAAALQPEHAHLWELYRAARESGGAVRGAPRLETALMHRLAAPAASMIMPLLAALAGFGLHRSHTLLARIAVGLALGFGYFVFDNFMVVMGRLDAAPAYLAAFAAPVSFLILGLAIRK